MTLILTDLQEYCIVLGLKQRGAKGSRCTAQNPDLEENLLSAQNTTRVASILSKRTAKKQKQKNKIYRNSQNIPALFFSFFFANAKGWIYLLVLSLAASLTRLLSTQVSNRPTSCFFRPRLGRLLHRFQSNETEFQSPFLLHNSSPLLHAAI